MSRGAAKQQRWAAAPCRQAQRLSQGWRQGQGLCAGEVPRGWASTTQRSSVLRRGDVSIIPSSSGVSRFVSPDWLLGTEAAEQLAQVTLRGLVHLNKTENMNSEVTQTPQDLSETELELINP